MSKRSASGTGQAGEATSANPGTAAAPTLARKVATKRAPSPKAGAAARPVAKRTAKVPPDAAKPAGRPATEKAQNGGTAKAEKTTPKPKKARLVRDSFTMPETEHALLGEVKRRCIANGLVVKKSEVLRAAILGLAAQDDASLRAAVLALAVIKVGRPPKKRK